jgi:hypothetical protein
MAPIPFAYLEEEHKTWETCLPYHSVTRDYLRNVRQIGVGAWEPWPLNSTRGKRALTLSQ